jgi:glycosyltransferase involved in cell wall biosynthesis
MNVGGPAVLIASTMRGLDPDAFQSRLLTGYCAADEADYLETQATDIAVERIEGLGRSVRPWSDLTAAGTLARRFRELQPDVIHTHTAKAGVVGRVAARLARTNAALVHTYHGHLLHGYFSPRKTRAVVGLERLLASRTDRLVAVAAGVRDDLLAAGIGAAEQYEVIPPGVELPVLPDRTTARIALGIDPNRPVVTMLGRLTSIKRPDRFADAVGILRVTHPTALFAVAGSGDQEDYLRARVDRERLPVLMLGWRSDPEVVIAASDVLVLTSDNEGTPLSLIQAGMAGVPVVATDVGSVGSVVEDGQTGVLCAPTAAAVAAGVADLLSDPAFARRLGRQARERMQREYGMDAMIARHAALYQSLGT